MNKIKFKFNSVDLTASLPDEAAQSVWAEIFKEREYKICEEIVRDATDPVVDVGAHVGLFALYTRALSSKVSIFALEPETDNFAMLNANIKDNKLTKIKTLQIALGNRTGETHLLVSLDSHNHRVVNAPSDEFIEEKDIQPLTEIVKTFTLRDFLDKQKIEKVSLLKMDIEGGEYDVFSACLPEDFARIGNIIMEYHNYGGLNYKEIEIQLRINGFGVQIFPSKFDKKMGFIFARNKRI